MELLDAAPVGSRLLLGYGSLHDTPEPVRTCYTRVNPGDEWVLVPRLNASAGVRREKLLPIIVDAASIVAVYGPDKHHFRSWEMHHPGLIRVDSADGLHAWACRVCGRSDGSYWSAGEAGDAGRVHAGLAHQVRTATVPSGLAS